MTLEDGAREGFRGALYFDNNLGHLSQTKPSFG
jgi:hypothetical protein